MLISVHTRELHHVAKQVTECKRRNGCFNRVRDNLDCGTRYAAKIFVDGSKGTQPNSDAMLLNLSNNFLSQLVLRANHTTPTSLHSTNALPIMLLFYPFPESAQGGNNQGFHLVGQAERQAQSPRPPRTKLAAPNLTSSLRYTAKSPSCDCQLDPCICPRI